MTYNVCVYHEDNMNGLCVNSCASLPQANTQYYALL